MNDEQDPRPGVGLYCFLNGDRSCGPDCMAFRTGPVEGSDYTAPDGSPHQWTACMLLVHSHKLSKHVVLVANMMRAMDAKNQPMPQTPFIPKVST